MSASDGFQDIRIDWNDHDLGGDHAETEARSGIVAIQF
jgi:hypothetical protein